MNKEELIITNEDIELLKEMKNNCLKTDVYNDEKRLLKANAITKFLMLQQENQQLKENNQAMQEEMARTWKKLEVIKKLKSWLLERLDDENDIFSVVRVRDVLFRLNKLENKGEENEKDI